MKVKVKGNLSSAVHAIKDQQVTVNSAQGRSLIDRGLATEVIEPAAAYRPGFCWQFDTVTPESRGLYGTVRLGFCIVVSGLGRVRRS